MLDTVGAIVGTGGESSVYVSATAPTLVCKCTLLPLRCVRRLPAASVDVSCFVSSCDDATSVTALPLSFVLRFARLRRLRGLRRLTRAASGMPGLGLRGSSGAAA